MYTNTCRLQCLHVLIILKKLVKFHDSILYFLLYLSNLIYIYIKLDKYIQYIYIYIYGFLWVKLDGREQKVYGKLRFIFYLYNDVSVYECTLLLSVVTCVCIE
jgi:hypothetical protein